MKIEIISTTRTALIDVIRHLMQGIEPAFLHDPARPLLVSVDGPFMCGKSLIPDAARAELMGASSKLRDSDIWQAPEIRLAETWHGVAHGKEIELSFMNAHAPIDTKSFFAQHKHGGIAFITNATDGHAQDEFYVRADINIWLFPQGVGDSHEMAGSSLKETFNAMAGEWVRYVQIEVKDERLLSSPHFRKAIDTIHAHKSVIGLYEADPALKTPDSFCP